MVLRGRWYWLATNMPQPQPRLLQDAALLDLLYSYAFQQAQSHA